MKTEKINLSALRNEEHFQYHAEFKASVIRHNAETLNISDAFLSYQVLLDQEFEALQVVRRSVATDLIADIDRERDDIYRGLADVVRSGLNHFSSNKRNASKRIKVLLDQYGNIARKSYDEETAAISKMMQEVQTTYLPDVNLLGLGEWFSELDKKNKEFDLLMKNRYTEEAAKTELRMRQVRVDVDNSYRDLVNRIDALVLINGSSGYEEFIREMNARIERFSHTGAQRKGRNAKDSKIEAKSN